MAPASRLIGVGLFVLMGLLLFAAGLFMIGERRLLFVENFEVFAEFERVTGLQRGATVRVSGLTAGEVLEIQVPAGPSLRFRVRMRVREDLHPLVRRDAVASIQTDGLIGNKYIQIDKGTDQSPPIADGGMIRSTEPFEIAHLLRQASDTIANVNEAINNLRADIEKTIEITAGTVAHVDALVDEVEDEVQTIANAGRQITEDARDIIEGVRTGRGTLGKLFTDDELYQRAAQIATETEATVGTVRAAVQEAREALVELRGSDVAGRGQGVIVDLRQTVRQAREAMSDLAETTEALKRNWFFRGFFNRRGYFDLNALSVADYRRGALEAEGRGAIRIWLDAAYLFSLTSDGGTELSDQGKSRLDSAMSTILGHPRETVLVIEGYAESSTNDERYLLSRQRASQVREYLLQKYELEPNRVGMMPLGLEAPGSPRGDRWSGVALAAFVRRLGSR